DATYFSGPVDRLPATAPDASVFETRDLAIYYFPCSVTPGPNPTCGYSGPTPEPLFDIHIDLFSNPVPEPDVGVLLVAGAVGFALSRRNGDQTSQGPDSTS